MRSILTFCCCTVSFMPVTIARSNANIFSDCFPSSWISTRPKVCFIHLFSLWRLDIGRKVFPWRYQTSCSHDGAWKSNNCFNDNDVSLRNFNFLADVFVISIITSLSCRASVKNWISTIICLIWNCRTRLESGLETLAVHLWNWTLKFKRVFMFDFCQNLAVRMLADGMSFVKPAGSRTGHLEHSQTGNRSADEAGRLGTVTIETSFPWTHFFPASQLQPVLDCLD